MVHGWRGEKIQENQKSQPLSILVCLSSSLCLLSYLSNGLVKNVCTGACGGIHIFVLVGLSNRYTYIEH